MISLRNLPTAAVGPILQIPAVWADVFDLSYAIKSGEVFLEKSPLARLGEQRHQGRKSTPKQARKLDGLSDRQSPEHTGSLA